MTREVRLIAGAEDQRVPLAEPVGELALEILVQRQRAVGGARAGRAGAVLDEWLRARPPTTSGSKREAEIVVRAEHQRRPAADDDFARAEDLLDDGRSGSRCARLELSRLASMAFSLSSRSLRFSVTVSHSRGACRGCGEIAALVKQLRRGPPDFSARRPRYRAARHQHDVVHTRPQTSTIRRRIASVSSLAGTVPLGSAIDHRPVGTRVAPRAKRDDAPSPDARQLGHAPLEILRVIFPPVDDDQILDAAADEQFAVRTGNRDRL